MQETQRIHWVAASSAIGYERIIQDNEAFCRKSLETRCKSRNKIVVNRGMTAPHYASAIGQQRIPVRNIDRRTLDSLLDERYEDATFHDAELLSFAVDFARATAVFEFNIQCRAKVPDQQYSFQQGTVEFSGLCFCLVEPLGCQTRPSGKSSLWITSDGALPDKQLQISEIVPGDLPGDAFVHYLYSSSTNSFIVVGARNAIFSWRHTAA